MGSPAWFVCLVGGMEQGQVTRPMEQCRIEVTQENK